MRVALTGATGFIGSRIAQGLVDSGVSVTAVTRNVHRPFPPGVTAVSGNLDSDDELRDALTGCDTLIHSASYVGPDEDVQQRINVIGTERLLVAARNAGISRIVYLSTSGVYGGAFPPYGDETQLVPAPRSSLSRSRYEAELRVAESGGTIIRPNMVVGAGDIWFLLPLVRLLLELNAWIDGGASQVSVINVAALGRAVARLALSVHDGGVYHVANVGPVSIRELATPVMVAGGRDVPTRTLSFDEARRMLLPRGVSENQLRIVARDNVLDVRRIWRVVPEKNPTTVLLPPDVAWYTTSL